MTIDVLRALAEAQGLALTDEELAALLPLVRAGRDPLATLQDMPIDDDPAIEFRSSS